MAIAPNLIAEKLARLGYTNEHNIPPVVLSYLIADDYDYSPNPMAFSITELLQPAAITVLWRRHKQEIKRDVMDNIWTSIGRSVHRDVLRCAEKARATALMEERIEVPLEVGGKTYIVRMKSDVWFPIKDHPEMMLTEDGKRQIAENGAHIDDYGIVGDFKVTSVWTMIFRDRLVDWQMQLSGYAWGLEKALGLKTVCGENYVFMKDWSQSEHDRRPGDYPPIPFERVHQSLLPMEQVELWIKSKIAAIVEMSEKPDHMLEPCTPVERWEKPAKFAVMKAGATRALRVCDTKDEALAYCAENGLRGRNGIDIVERPAVRTRCEQYCDVRQYCPLYAGVAGLKPEEPKPHKTLPDLNKELTRRIVDQKRDNVIPITNRHVQPKGGER